MERRRKAAACLRTSPHQSTLPKRLMTLRTPSQRTGSTLPSKQKPQICRAHAAGQGIQCKHQHCLHTLCVTQSLEPQLLSVAMLISSGCTLGSLLYNLSCFATTGDSLRESVNPKPEHFCIVFWIWWRCELACRLLLQGLVLLADLAGKLVSCRLSMHVSVCLKLGDTCRIADPEASKPDDWDEDAPKEIVDEEAEKPEGWLDDEPEEIDDPGKFVVLAPRVYWTSVYLCVIPRRGRPRRGKHL